MSNKLPKQFYTAAELEVERISTPESEALAKEIEKRSAVLTVLANSLVKATEAKFFGEVLEFLDAELLALNDKFDAMTIVGGK